MQGNRFACIPRDLGFEIWVVVTMVNQLLTGFFQVVLCATPMPGMDIVLLKLSQQWYVKCNSPGCAGHIAGITAVYLSLCI